MTESARRPSRYRRHARLGRTKAWLNSDAGERWVVYPIFTIYALIFAASLAALAYAKVN